MLPMPRAARLLPTLCLALLATGALGAPPCPSLSDRLKIALGIGDGFSTQLRVEIKSVNTGAQTETFYALLRRPFGIADVATFELGAKVRDAGGQSFQLRDVPSDPARLELVTSTNYLFDREVQDRLDARLRIRDYGVVDRSDPTAPWRHDVDARDTVSLEVKAKTAQDGVVVKPILQMEPALHELMFGKLVPATDGTRGLVRVGGTHADFARNRPEIERRLVASNPGLKPGVVPEVLATVDSFFSETERLKKPLTAINIQYHRKAFVLEVKHQATGEVHKIQITMDQLIGMRRGVDAAAPPIASAASPLTGFASQSPAFVVEMKTDLQLDAAYAANPAQVAKDFPLYVEVRRAFEALQATPLPGYQAGRGKASQLSDSPAAEALQDAD